MTKCATVLAGLLKRLSRSDFGKAVQKRQTDKDRGGACYIGFIVDMQNP
jgi:hypothetical protein